VIAARWGLLLVAALSIFAVWGSTSAQTHPPELRVEVSAVIGMLAPLFWPGRAPTTSGTVLRVLAWSAAASAAVAAFLLVHPGQPWNRVAPTCAMLMAILVLVHSAAVVLEDRWSASSPDPRAARELAGRAMASALAVLCTLPFWLGPVAESLTARHPGIIDIVVGLSPVTHLAVAGGNDLLRNPWLYEHSNLAVLLVSYPGLGTLAAAYASACVVLAVIALASRRARRPTSANAIDSAPEPSR
jgi:hypothetical protein